MNKKEFKECIIAELKIASNSSFLEKVRNKYITPNTNCIFLSRKMWYYYEKGTFGKIISKILYLKIIRRYGCIIYPSAKVGKGFHIAHPVGIVLGECEIGENFKIYQNCTIGTKYAGSGSPKIGNNVRLCSGSEILGNVTICDNVIIGAHSLVLKDISEPGTYAGSPVSRKGEIKRWIHKEDVMS